MTLACVKPNALEIPPDFARFSSKFGILSNESWFNSPSISVVRDESLNDITKFPINEIAQCLERTLSIVLVKAREAVFEQVRYLGDQQSRQIIQNLEQILSLDSWDEGDKMLKISSVRTMIKAIIALNEGPGQITMARGGNVVSTWEMGNKVLRIEAHSIGTVSWTILHPRGSQPRHQHSNNDTIESLKVAIANL